MVAIEEIPKLFHCEETSGERHLKTFERGWSCKHVGGKYFEGCSEIILAVISIQYW